MRNCVIASIISASIPFFPFWEWDGEGEMIVAAAVFYWITLALLIATERGRQSNEEKADKRKTAGDRKCRAA